MALGTGVLYHKIQRRRAFGAAAKLPSRAPPARWSSQPLTTDHSPITLTTHSAPYCFLNSRYPRFMFPSFSICSVRRLRPLERVTFAASLARFQWCHCRQPVVSLGSLVVAILIGVPRGLVFTSSDSSPPLFDV